MTARSIVSASGRRIIDAAGRIIASGGGGYATQFSVAVSPASGTLGFAATVTYAPLGGAWPVGTVLTLVNTSIAGTFTVAGSTVTTLSPSGFASISAVFTPSAAATGTINATANTAITSTGPATLTATAVPNSLTLASPRFVSQGTAQTFIGTFPTGTTFSNLQYSLNDSTWQALPSGAASSGTTFSFPLTFASISNSLQVYIRDSTNTGTVASTSQFSCNAAPVYTTTPISGTLPSSIRLGLMAHGANVTSHYHTSAPGFAKGQFNPTTQRLLGQIGSGSTFEIYCDQIKKWADGSVRTCRVSAQIPGTLINSTETVVTVTIDNNPRATGALTTASALVAAHDWNVKHYGGQCGTDVFGVSLRDIVTNFSQDHYGTNPLGGWDLFANNPSELGIHGWRYWKRASDSGSDAWRRTDIWVSQRIDGTYEMLARVTQPNYDVAHPSGTVNASSEHSLVCFHELYQDTTLIGAWGGPNDTTTSLSSATTGIITIPASNFNVSTNVVSGVTPAYGTPVLFAAASGGTLPSGITAGTPYYLSGGSVWGTRGGLSGQSNSSSPGPVVTFGSAGSGNVTVTPAYGSFIGSGLILAAPNGYPYLIGGTRTQVTVAWDETYMSKWATLFPSYAQTTDTTFQMTRYTSAQVTDFSGFTSFVPNQPTVGFWLNTTGDNPGDPRIGFVAMRGILALLVPHDAAYDVNSRVEGLGWGDQAMYWNDVSAGRVLNFGNTTLTDMGPPRPNAGFSYNGGDAWIGSGGGADNSGYFDGYSAAPLTSSHMPVPWVVPYHRTGHPVFIEMGVYQSVAAGVLADGSQANKTLNSTTYYGVISASQDEQTRGFAWVMRCWDFAEGFLSDSRPEAAYIKTQLDVSERYWRDHVDWLAANKADWFNLGLAFPDAHYIDSPSAKCQPYMHAMAFMALGHIASHRERDFRNMLSAAGNLVINLFDDAASSPNAVGSYMGYNGVGYYWPIIASGSSAYANLQAFATAGAAASDGVTLGSPPYPTTGLPTSTSNGAPNYNTNGGFPWGTGGDYPMLFRCGLATNAGLGTISFNGGQALRAHGEWVTRMTTSPCTGIKFSGVGGDGSLGNTGPHWYPTWAIVPVSYP